MVADDCDVLRLTGGTDDRSMADGYSSEHVLAVQAAAMELRRDSIATHHYHHRPSLRPIGSIYTSVKSTAPMVDHGQDGVGVGVGLGEDRIDDGRGHGQGQGQGQGQEGEGEARGGNNTILLIASTHADGQSTTAATDKAATATVAATGFQTPSRLSPVPGADAGLIGNGGNSPTATSNANAVASASVIATASNTTAVQAPDKEEVCIPDSTLNQP